MGLNISHNIVVQQHNGRLDVESQPGRTVFQIRIPRNGSVQ
jgi:signal transduction histidine kinase